MSDWISVKERLPEVYADVWVWVKFNDHSCGTESWLEEGSTIDKPLWAMGSAKRFTVTHWMPLPDLPEAAQ